MSYPYPPTRNPEVIQPPPIIARHPSRSPIANEKSDARCRREIGGVAAIPSRSEPGVDGLMPLSYFKTLSVCNSEGYVVFESRWRSGEFPKLLQ